MSTIEANVSRMFYRIEPWDCSNNAATMGDRVGEITWGNALSIARDHAEWLKTPLSDACAAMAEWARSTGAWTKDEIEAWRDVELLALFVQNVASELRTCLEADDHELNECVEIYEQTDWERECEYPIGSYSLEGSDVLVDYYCGC